MRNWSPRALSADGAVEEVQELAGGDGGRDAAYQQAELRVARGRRGAGPSGLLACSKQPLGWCLKCSTAFGLVLGII